MKRTIVTITTLLCAMVMGCGAEEEKEVVGEPHIMWNDPVEAGRYLVVIGQCNDCHTDAYMEKEGAIPEDDWLTGSAIGWQGPWGTTYPSNLRLRVQEWTVDQWVETLKSRKGLPPMPWVSVNKMSEQDLRAIYTYIKSLGPKGEHMPIAVAPGVIPQTPYLSLVPQNLPADVDQ